MTQEEKKLLAKDLAGRLPYGVNGLITIHITMSEDITPNRVIDGKLYDRFVNLQESWYHNIPSIRPYLRPMSSMTEEEKENLQSLHDIISNENYGDGYSPSAWDAITEWEDYCNSRHLDYRGLIGKGLALEAPKGMYTKEDKQ